MRVPLRWIGLVMVLLAAAPAYGLPDESLPSLSPSAEWSTLELALPAGWIAPSEGLVLDRGRPVAVATRDYIDNGRRNTYEGLGYLRCMGDCARPGAWRFTVIRESGAFDYVTLRVDPWGRPRVVFLADGGVHYGGCDVQCHEPHRWSWTRIDPGAAGNPVDPIERIAFRLDEQGRPHVAYVIEEPDPDGSSWVLPVVSYATCATDCLQAAGWTIVKPVPKESASTVRLALYRGKPRIAYLSRPGPLHVPGLLGTGQLHYIECWANRDCLSRGDWTPPTQLTANHPPVPFVPVPGVSALDASDTGVDLIYSDLYGRRMHRRCAADCYREAGVSWSPPRSVSAHVGTYQSLLSLSHDGDGHPRTMLFGERYIPNRAAEREVRYGWCVSSCASALDWREERADVPVTEIATMRFDGMRPRLLASPYDRSTRTFSVTWSWCDESCGEPALWPERPDSTPPATGPGARPIGAPA